MIWLLAVAALAGAVAQDDPQTSVEELRQVVQDSCAQRAYGAYDDVCDQLKQRLHQAEVAADRAGHKAQRKDPKPAPNPPSAQPSTPDQGKPAVQPATPHPLGYKPPPQPQG